MESVIGLDSDTLNFRRNQQCPIENILLDFTRVETIWISRTPSHASKTSFIRIPHSSNIRLSEHSIIRYVLQLFCSISFETETVYTVYTDLIVTAVCIRTTLTV